MKHICLKNFVQKGKVHSLLFFHAFVQNIKCISPKYEIYLSENFCLEGEGTLAPLFFISFSPLVSQKYLSEIKNAFVQNMKFICVKIFCLKEDDTPTSLFLSVFHLFRFSSVIPFTSSPLLDRLLTQNFLLTLIVSYSQSVNCKVSILILPVKFTGEYLSHSSLFYWGKTQYLSLLKQFLLKKKNIIFIFLLLGKGLTFILFM